MAWKQMLVVVVACSACGGGTSRTTATPPHNASEAPPVTAKASAEPTNVLAIDDEPVAVAYAKLTELVAAPREMRRRTRTGDERPLAYTVVGKDPDPDEETVVLSIEVLRDRVALGLSRVMEVQYIPHMPTGELDWTKLRNTLQEHKNSAFFSERRDVELAAHPSVKSHALLDVAEAAAAVGFTQISLLAPENLSFRPSADDMIE